uniref:Uncharacterized protein n=1 Tax=Rhodopseudomonas palustris (strain BisA53) TaxID=316055 RepID=Q07HV0_RHOP5
MMAMWQSLTLSLGSSQGDIVRSRSAAMPAGEAGMVALAFSLGALTALTPGHGKARWPRAFSGGCILAATACPNAGRMTRGRKLAVESEHCQMCVT